MIPTTTGRCNGQSVPIFYQFKTGSVTDIIFDDKNTM